MKLFQYLIVIYIYLNVCIVYGVTTICTANLTLFVLF